MNEEWNTAKPEQWRELQDLAHMLGLSSNCATIAHNLLVYSNEFKSMSKEELKGVDFQAWVRVPNIGAKTRRLIWEWLHPSQRNFNIKTYALQVRCPRCSFVMRGKLEAGGFTMHVEDYGVPPNE